MTAMTIKLTRLAALLTLAVLLHNMVLFSGTLEAETAASPPNILFIAVDDLNDWVGALGGHPQALTPNMDKLAERGLLFTNAHCTAPGCNASRTSLLMGLRPSTTEFIRTHDCARLRWLIPPCTCHNISGTARRPEQANFSCPHVF